MSNLTEWRLDGTYVEACNCEAVCPCRSYGAREGGKSTFGTCDFALSWNIEDGRAGEVVLSGLDVVLAGSFADDPRFVRDVPREEWSVALYIDDAATGDQASALEEIFLGRAGGSTLSNFAAAIGSVHAVRRANVRLDHRPGRQKIDVDGYVTARALRPVETDEPVSCGIPGHDRPGTELIADTLRVDDGPLVWDVSGRCGFATDFSYSGGELD